MDEFFNIDLSQLSLFNFLGLAIQGVVIFAILWLFRNYLILLIVQSPVKRKKVLDKEPAVSTLIWLLFVLHCLYVIIKPFPFFGVLLTLIFIYLGRGYLVNLIHGLFFRLKGDIEVGQRLALDSYSGTVINTKVFELELQNPQGEIIQIPYGNMARKEIIKKDYASDFSSHKFSVLLDSSVTEAQLKKKLMILPWLSSVFEPKVTKAMQSEDKVRFDIIVYSLDEKYHSLIENDIKRNNIN